MSEKPDFGDANGFMDPLMEDFQRIFDKFVLPETLSLESTKVLILSRNVCPRQSYSFFNLIRSGAVLNVKDITQVLDEGDIVFSCLFW